MERKTSRDFDPEVLHSLNNDTTRRYDEAAAKLAWQRTIAFFNNNLSRS
jgi:carboxymethylenebutenolidase